MAKFKVGDKVRILDGSKIENYTGSWSIFGNMNKYIGTIQTIKEVNEDQSDGRVSYYMEDIGYMWDERGLELATEQKQPKIVITTDGKTTTAVLYNGKQRIKSAKAKCASSDTFDFNIDASIALKRLTGQILGKVENTIFDWKGFKASKFNVVVNRDNIDRFLKECDEHDISWYDSKASEWNPIKKMDAEPEPVKTMMKIILGFKSNYKCELKVIDGNLAYSFTPDMRDETVIYD